MTTNELMALIRALIPLAILVAYVGIVRAKRFRTADGRIRTYSYAWWTVVLCTPFGLGLIWAALRALRPFRLQKQRAK